MPKSFKLLLMNTENVNYCVSIHCFNAKIKSYTCHDPSPVSFFPQKQVDGNTLAINNSVLLDYVRTNR